MVCLAVDTGFCAPRYGEEIRPWLPLPRRRVLPTLSLAACRGEEGSAVGHSTRCSGSEIGLGASRRDETHERSDSDRYKIAEYVAGQGQEARGLLLAPGFAAAAEGKTRSAVLSELLERAEVVYKPQLLLYRSCASPFDV